MPLRLAPPLQATPVNYLWPLLVAAGEGTLGQITLVAMVLIVGGAVLGGRS